MATRNGPVTVDTTTVTTGGTPVDLTADDFTCSQVFLIANEANVGINVYLVDSNDNAKTIVIPSVGMTVLVQNPKLIRVSADEDADKIDWAAA